MGFYGDIKGWWLGDTHSGRFWFWPRCEISRPCAHRQAAGTFFNFKVLTELVKMGGSAPCLQRGSFRWVFAGSYPRLFGVLKSATIVPGHSVLGRNLF
jgi:hypothetical protein